MFSSVEYVRELCKQRHIPISTLEMDCGFANGYLNPKKLKKIPYDRAIKIAEYLNISAEILLTGEQKEKSAPGGDELDEVTKKLHQLIGQSTAEEREQMLDYMEFMQSRKNKKI